jgi:hypothetical protein
MWVEASAQRSVCRGRRVHSAAKRLVGRRAQQSFQPTLKAAQFVAFMGSVGLGAAEAVVVFLAKIDALCPRWPNESTFFRRFWPTPEKYAKSFAFLDCSFSSLTHNLPSCLWNLLP